MTGLLPQISSDQAFTLHSVMRETGLDELARRIEGDTFAVCDLNTHGVAGCAAMREALLQQHVFAEWVALGLTIFVAVIAGSIAVGFVHLFARAIRRARLPLPPIRVSAPAFGPPRTSASSKAAAT